MLGTRTVGIVGTGLIGTSIGLAIRQRRVAARVVGVDVDENSTPCVKRTSWSSRSRRMRWWAQP